MSESLRIMIENAVHHIFLGLYCAHEDILVGEVHKSFTKMGIASLGVRVTQMREKALTDSKDMQLSDILLNCYSSEDTFRAVTTIEELVVNLH